jgi:hypothetical protein
MARCNLREKDFNTGLRGVLFEERHYARMGAALWLYGWLVLRQTHQQGSLGWVLGGAPISYREIEEETGFNRRTLERWMRTLRQQGYIETDVAPNGIVVRVTKAKKFRKFQNARQFPQYPQGAGRNSAGGVRKSAGSATRSRVATGCQSHSFERVASGIGSSFVERSKEKNMEIHRDSHSTGENGYDHNAVHQDRQQQLHTKTEKPSCVRQEQDFNQSQHQNKNRKPQLEDRQPTQEYSQRQFWIEARMRLELMRAEREEVVRRELAVGTGPEVRRS